MPGEYVPPEALVLRLARKLYDQMEFLDPGTEPLVAWDDLASRERELYVLLIEDVLNDLSDDHAITRNHLCNPQL